VTFAERAGDVRVVVRFDGARPRSCELTAPQRLTLGRVVAPGLVAAAISVSAEDIVGATHPPRVASVGLPFVFVELRDRAALARARVDQDAFGALAATAGATAVYLYTRDTGDAAVDLRGRMYAPLHGVGEDPATGSASCALAGLLAHGDASPTGTFRFAIAQGVEMGRPSRLEASAEKADGAVNETRVGGASVLVGEGWIEVD
jgi:trans-2,3-dihydro-3-hydroxyanthranilate isomerase